MLFPESPSRASARRTSPSPLSPILFTVVHVPKVYRAATIRYYVTGLFFATAEREMRSRQSIDRTPLPKKGHGKWVKQGGNGAAVAEQHVHRKPVAGFRDINGFSNVLTTLRKPQALRNKCKPGLS